MIIESKFHDYYDPIAKRFIDKSIVYKRHAKLIKEKSPIELPRGPEGWDVDTVNYLVFCGKLYPFVIITDKKKVNSVCRNYGPDLPINWGYKNDIFSYNIDDVRKIVGCQYKHWNNISQDKLTNALNFNWIEFSIKHKCPVFIIYPNNNQIILNPSLRECKFYQVKDINQTFQELRTFISMVLTEPEKSARPITDKQRAENHGFNKFSFRKDTPPTRKQK